MDYIQRTRSNIYVVVAGADNTTAFDRFISKQKRRFSLSLTLHYCLLHCCVKKNKYIDGTVDRSTKQE